MIITKSQVDYSIPFDNTATGFVSTNVHDAILESATIATSKTRFTITLVANAIMGNGQIFRYSELLPNTPVILPINCVLKEITFSCDSNTQDWKFTFSRIRSGVSTYLFDWTGTNEQKAALSDLNHAFIPLDEVHILHTDVGNNPSDSVMVLFFEVSY